MTPQFLGKGWEFPVRPVSGHLRLIEGADKISQSIELILGTAPGERPMRPEFGCGIHELVFQANTSTLHAVIQANVEEALQRWEPRIDVLEVRVTPQASVSGDHPNQLEIAIDYRIRANNARNNLVYPFFLNENAA